MCIYIYIYYFRILVRQLFRSNLRTSKTYRITGQFFLLEELEQTEQGRFTALPISFQLQRDGRSINFAFSIVHFWWHTWKVYVWKDNTWKVIMYLWNTIKIWIIQWDRTFGHTFGGWHSHGPKPRGCKGYWWFTGKTYQETSANGENKLQYNWLPVGISSSWIQCIIRFSTQEECSSRPSRFSESASEGETCQKEKRKTRG